MNEQLGELVAGRICEVRPHTTQEATADYEYRNGLLCRRWSVKSFANGYWTAHEDEWRPVAGQASRCPGHEIDYQTSTCKKCGWNSTPQEQGL